MENVAEYYFERLSKSLTPGPVLTELYGALYNFKTTRSEIIMFNKLIKVFGRFTVFFSTIDLAGTYPVRQDNPYPLLYAICKNKFERTHHSAFLRASTPLDKYLENIDKEIEIVEKAWAREKKKEEKAKKKEEKKVEQQKETDG